MGIFGNIFKLGDQCFQQKVYKTAIIITTKLKLLKEFSEFYKIYLRIGNVGDEKIIKSFFQSLSLGGIALRDLALF